MSASARRSAVLGGRPAPSAIERGEHVAAPSDRLLCDRVEHEDRLVGARRGEVAQGPGSGKKEVTGANVLVAIFGEKDSHAVYYLHQQGVTRLDVVNFIAHGIKKSDPPEPSKPSEPQLQVAARPDTCRRSSRRRLGTARGLRVCPARSANTGSCAVAGPLR